MTDRSRLADAFVAQTEWATARRAPLAGDASNRKYMRLFDDANRTTAVLMDAPRDKGEDIRPFVRIARHLEGNGLSAPKILAEDADNGFLLLEDLGDDLFARVVATEPALETLLYRAATDVLLTLHDAPMIDLVAYDPPRMAELAGLAFSKYRAGIAGDDGGAAFTNFRARFEDLLAEVTKGSEVMILRDYHAENLLWLPDRNGVARVGLLDFQDAMAGHPAYDLVSLLQDVRRDVSAAVESDCIRHYVDRSGCDGHAFRTAYAVLGAQRNLRILGVFARLAIDYGKPHYVQLIPRVWAHLLRDLDHPALAAIAGPLLAILPEPTETALSRLAPP